VWNEASEFALKTISYSDIRDLSVRDPAGRIRVSAGLCQSVAYDTWVSRPGRSLLSSSFILVRITKFLLTRSPGMAIVRAWSGEREAGSGDFLF
jgi:hypothetical protein